MLRFSSLIVAAASLAFAFLAVPNAGQAAELPEGVTIELIAEYPSMTPGVEKILLRKLVMKPGVSWDLTVPAESVCQGTKGELTAVDHTSGKTYVFKAGDRWSTSPGHEMTLSSTGTVDHEQLFYTLIAAE